MRRSEKEIKDLEVIESIMKEALECRIGLCEDNKPYIVPMNFGCKDNYLYIHSALEGKKIEILKKNSNVCFEVDVKTEVVKANNPCGWSMKYLSVIGFGKAYFVEDLVEKAEALNAIMEKYSGKADFKFPEAALKKVAVIKIEIEEITGKKSKD
ncbi:pyridoxamine 5'-phosphate oxidase family protein [Clostridium tunisiense]|uniref:pyridoxamine 5'-phosphate oxidase family protein n=1 Tax=Clostridium tunisiense TaxID=219748 RepID=UPI00030C5343|nr:pyridoxamine 5'-phosphate oxidase family protein [Clostridium tunisiense]